MKKGQPHTEETKRKIIEMTKLAMARPKVKDKMIKNHADFNGSRNPFWGRTHSDELKEKMRKIMIGDTRRLGCKHSEETREKMKKSHPSICGKNHPNWKGGISIEPYSSAFNIRLKEEIRKRDNYQCQFCGIKENGKAHDVHHVDYDKKNSSKLNLISLCVSHNSQANKDREKWQFFFETIQEIRLIQCR